DLARQRPFGGGDIELDASDLGQVPEHDIGIGDGRGDATTAVARGTRIGAGRLRADVQRARTVDPGDAAATGTDLDEVDGRDLEEEPARPAAGRAAHAEVVGALGTPAPHAGGLR